GFVLTAGAIGRLSANHIQIGPKTEYDPNYDPSKKETPNGAQQKADNAQLNAEGYADVLKTAIDNDISDISDSLGNLDEYIDTSFHDGIIEEAEAKAIEKYINSLNAEYDNLNEQVSKLVNNDYISTDV